MLKRCEHEGCDNTAEFVVAYAVGGIDHICGEHLPHYVLTSDCETLVYHQEEKA